MDVTYPVRFYGYVKKEWSHGKEKFIWEGGDIVIAKAYDNPVPGYGTFNTINLRLWKSCPASEFDFKSFNTVIFFNFNNYFKGRLF